MKLKLATIAILSAIVTPSWSISGIAIPNIVVPDRTIDSFVNDSTYIIPDNETIQKTKQQINQISLIINQHITSNIPITTTTIDKNTLDTINFNDDDSEVSIESEPTIINQLSSKVKSINSIIYHETPESYIPFSYPDYVLMGDLVAITAGNQIQQIGNSFIYSNIYTLDIAVKYKLIKTSDKSIILSFISHGQSGEAMLQDNKAPKVPADINELINQTYNQLANETISRVTEKLNTISESNVSTTESNNIVQNNKNST